MPQDKRPLQIVARLCFCFLLATLSACSVEGSAMHESNEPDKSVPQGEFTAAETGLLIAQSTATEYRTYDLPQATVHVVKVSPHSAEVSLSIVVADELETVGAIARRSGAIAAINAGFFDPQNGKTTSYLFSRGELIGDPTDNERLVGNPDLQSYLPSILNRSEFRLYRCDGSSYQTYDIARREAAVPADCQLDSAVGAGPQLLPTDTSTEEAFTDYADGELIRDAIGSRQPNARSAIGIVGDTQDVLLMMVAQRPDAPGFTLSDLSDFATTLGVETLLNLDGGSSSTLYYQGQTYTARLDADGNPIERPVKSVILVK